MTSNEIDALAEGIGQAICDVVVDHPMWIGDNGEELDYLPERELRISEFIHEATAALFASPAMAQRDALLQAIAWEQGHIAGDNYANCIEDAPNPYAEGDS